MVEPQDNWYHFMMKFRHLAAVLSFPLILAFTPPAYATMVSPTSVADLTKSATLIFVGTCDQRQTALRPFLTGQVPVSTYTFTVKEVLRTPPGVTVAVGKPFVFDQQGGELPPALQKPDVFIPVGAVVYQPGREYMLFLRATKDGVYAPIGLQQGRLNVLTGADGRKSVSNGPYNEYLFRGLQTPATTGKSVSKSVKSLVSGEQPIGEQGVGLDTMKDLVNTLQGK